MLERLTPLLLEAGVRVLLQAQTPKEQQVAIQYFQPLPQMEVEVGEATKMLD